MSTNEKKILSEEERQEFLFPYYLKRKANYLQIFIFGVRHPASLLISEGGRVSDYRCL